MPSLAPVFLSTVIYGATALEPRIVGAQPSCPTFTRVTLPKQEQSPNKFATFPGGFAMLAEVLTTDTDGASTAYHPDNIGSTHLCNGMNAWREGQCLKDHKACYAAVEQARAVKWNPATSPAFCIYGFEAKGPEKTSTGKVVWGAGHSNEELPIQKSGSAAPGFLISVTASPIHSPTAHGPVYADADRLPYLVMPSTLTGRDGPTGFRNAGAIVRMSDRHKIYAVVADSNRNPAEISVAAAQLLHDPHLRQPIAITVPELTGVKKPPPYPYKWAKDIGRVKVTSSVEGPYLVLALGAEYGKAPDYNSDLAMLKKLGDDAFASFGGAERLADCASQFFRH